MLNLFNFSKAAHGGSDNSLGVFVKTSAGKTLFIDLNPMWDIRKVKEIVAPKIGLHVDEIKIIFAGKELGDDVVINECDLGPQSILHAVKMKAERKVPKLMSHIIQSKISEIEESHVSNKPLCETLSDSMFSSESHDSSGTTVDTSSATNSNSYLKNLSNSSSSQNEKSSKVHFYVFCPTCRDLKAGKIRVRCHFCKSGAFTVHTDPQNWSDVLEAKKITGDCDNDEELCRKILNNTEPNFAEFYFKCAEHTSLGENDEAVPLYLIRPNLKMAACIACLDVLDTVFVFPCTEDHVLCLICFREYCATKLRERQFWQHPEFGYTLACPTGCADSFIKEIHHFRLLTETQYEQYHRFGAEEFVLQAGGVLCPQPGCGMGILIDPDCTKITCINGCGFVFCRSCLQGYHIGECDPQDGDGATSDVQACGDMAIKKNGDDASRIAIRVLTKPCPKCKTPTERDGGCMHMVCTRKGCEYHWCWVCQTEWTRECMGSHWFG